MLVEAEAVDQVIAQVRSEPRGIIRVSCPVALINFQFGELFARPTACRSFIHGQRADRAQQAARSAYSESAGRLPDPAQRLGDVEFGKAVEDNGRRKLIMGALDRGVPDLPGTRCAGGRL
ncbi:hypothetical protein T190_24735 [Sinorhizobium meliloti CCBAU 01290]|nr:hypothetical protein T190_24735 [Sinorhizobium meliloti CCBAU 01290]